MGWGGTAHSVRTVAGVQVKDKTGWHEEWEAVRERVAEGKATQLDPTMFPPPASANLPLHLCMRFLPHHQDTGGFFVAVLEKTRECADLVVPTQEHRGKGKRGKKVRTPRVPCCGGGRSTPVCQRCPPGVRPVGHARFLCCALAVLCYAAPWK